MSPRHQPAAWLCHECPRDAIVSMAIPRELPQGHPRRVHLCRGCAETAIALFDSNPGLGDPQVRWVGARRGVCRHCGCTDERACPGGCSWTNREHTMCSTCTEAAYEGLLEDMAAQGLLRKVSP